VVEMRVFEVSRLAGFELCHPVKAEDLDRISDEINGTSRKSTWTPIAMKIIHQDEGRALQESDSPWLGSDALIFRPSALHALEPMLLEHGELLPLQCDEAELALFNPTRVIDALDEATSTVRRLPAGRIFWIQQYVFKPATIEGIEIFKIPSLRVSPTFVRDRFVEAWRSTRLRGLEFKEVWNG
jgi:hypothetical protein